MRHQAKTQGFWGWVVLGLCALAVLAGAYQTSRTKTAKDPQTIETPSVCPKEGRRGGGLRPRHHPGAAGETGGPGLPGAGRTGRARGRRRSSNHRSTSHGGDGGGLLSGRPAV